MSTKSILQSDPSCIFCGSSGVDLHHVRLGNCTRAKAEKYGLVCFVCRKHHEQIHHDERKKRMLQQLAQRKLEETMTHEEYMEIFKKSYE